MVPGENQHVRVGDLFDAWTPHYPCGPPTEKSAVLVGRTAGQPVRGGWLYLGFGCRWAIVIARGGGESGREPVVRAVCTRDPGRRGDPGTSTGNRRCVA